MTNESKDLNNVVDVDVRLFVYKDIKHFFVMHIINVKELNYLCESYLRYEST